MDRLLIEASFWTLGETPEIFIGQRLKPIDIRGKNCRRRNGKRITDFWILDLQRFKLI
jgi:hypothetical protein